MFGSVTCGATATQLRAGKLSIRSLYARYKKKGFEFLLIYTKEPHPGENIPQPTTIEERAKNAVRLKEEEKVNFPILIDTPDNAVRNAYRGWSNGIFVVQQRRCARVQILLDSRSGVGPGSSRSSRLAKGSSPKRTRSSVLFREARWTTQEQKNQRQRPSPRRPSSGSRFRAAPRSRRKNRLGQATVSKVGDSGRREKKVGMNLRRCRRRS